MALYSDNDLNFNSRFFVCYFLSILLLISMPLLGIVMTGEPVDKFLEFPPLTRYVSHAPENNFVFLLGLITSLVFGVPLILRFLKYLGTYPPGPAKGTFPVWGLAGIAILLSSWGISWDIIKVPYSIRMWAFSPLWIGFIVCLNAISKWRLGTCVLERRPISFLLLFGISCVFWWYFEFLNRFVQNWYYVGVSHIGAWRYSLMASFSFSTVLPAVLSVNELLKCSCAFERAFDRPFWHFQPDRPFAIVMLIFSGTCLLSIGLWPDYLFPFLWISPLLIVCSMQIMCGLKNLAELAGQGRLGAIARLAASGLLCGFFWEMWNFWSYPKWIYSIPYVGQFKIFEMPLLGYWGYLPFGLECAAISTMVLPLEDIVNTPCLAPSCPRLKQAT